jgi:2-amino-4-hydroxy-6-hydroxymethyldihydropteridine diphosphokinase
MGDRHEHLSHAREALGNLPEMKSVVMSPVYETQPVGPIQQQPYLNAAAVIQTQLSPRRLLEQLNAIETQQGRDSLTTRVKWGPRPLDLDILFYDQQIIDEPGLLIPHPRMHERWFVLKPLNDIAPDWVHPTLLQTVAQLLQKVKP